MLLTTWTILFGVDGGCTLYRQPWHNRAGPLGVRFRRPDIVLPIVFEMHDLIIPISGDPESLRNSYLPANNWRSER
jgi:hypothetical protein